MTSRTGQVSGTLVGMMLDPPDEAERADDHLDEPARPPKKVKGGATTVLGAAMLAVGDILEPEKTTVEIVQTNDDPIDDLPFDIDFGNLPPLD